MTVADAAAPPPQAYIKPAPLCSVVIPTYNGRALLERCLESIARHRPSDPALSIEVIVADDASTDGTAQWLAHAHPDVRVVQLEQNGGFCAAANAGIAAARGRFIQLLNNDTEVTAGWIEAGLEPFSDPTVGSVAPLVLVRSDPGPGGFGRRFVLRWPAGRQSAVTASPGNCLRLDRQKRSSAPAARALSTDRRRCTGSAASIPC